MPKYGGKEIAAAFRTVRKNTVQVAEDIPENQYNFKATADTRSIAQTLVHIAYAPEFAFYIHGEKISDMAKVNFPVLFEKIAAEESKVRNKAEIIAVLKTQGDRYASFVEGLPDSFLDEVLTMPPFNISSACGTCSLTLLYCRISGVEASDDIELRYIIGRRGTQINADRENLSRSAFIRVYLRLKYL